MSKTHILIHIVLYIVLPHCSERSANILEGIRIPGVNCCGISKYITKQHGFQYEIPCKLLLMPLAVLL